MFNIYDNGTAFPPGYSKIVKNGEQIANFALFSVAASRVELCLFSGEKEICFPMIRTENVWHLALTGVEIGTEYGFRVYGEYAKQQK